MIPHLTLLHHMVTPRPLQFWYNLDMHHMSLCHAVTRLPGKSSGADAEVLEANVRGMIFVPIETIVDSETLNLLWESRFDG